MRCKGKDDVQRAGKINLKRSKPGALTGKKGHIQRIKLGERLVNSIG